MTKNFIIFFYEKFFVVFFWSVEKKFVVKSLWCRKWGLKIFYDIESVYLFTKHPRYPLKNLNPGGA
jgi:hypothetical protein